MEADVAFVARRCQTCQLNKNRTYAPIVELDCLSTRWPSHIWAFDLLSPINLSSRGHILIITTINCYTKLVEAIIFK